MACCLPTCAQGSSVPVTENVGSGVVLDFLASRQCLVHMLLVSSFFVYKAWVTSVCLLLDRPFRRRSVGHHLCDLWGEYLAAHKLPVSFVGFMGNS